MATKPDKPTAVRIEELESRGWTPDEVSELSDIIAQRKDLGEREKVIESTKKEVNERASCLMILHGNTSIACGLGTLSFRVSERHTVDVMELQLQLVARKVPVDVIKDSIKAATKASTTTSVEFRSAKEKP